jgi:hypothetical protein
MGVALGCYAHVQYSLFMKTIRGSNTSGFRRQFVLIPKYIDITEVYHGPAGYTVVCIERWSFVQVVLALG